MRRLIEEPAEFARVRRLYPAADQALLIRLPDEFAAQLPSNGNGSGNSKRHGNGALDHLARLEQTLSNAVQFSPQKGLLAEDMEAELDRLYRDHVEPPRYNRTTEDLSTRNAIRTRANHVFRATGVWPRLERHVRVDEFTFTGDPLHIDYSYRRNCTRGYIQTLPLVRDPGQAKVLAFTAAAIREKVPHSEFLAVTESAPRPQENPRHHFVAGLLEQADIPILPLTQLTEWARRMAPALRG